MWFVSEGYVAFVCTGGGLQLKHVHFIGGGVVVEDGLRYIQGDLGAASRPVASQVEVVHNQLTLGTNKCSSSQ